MSVNSLPSFAQAFSNNNLPDISPTLPPIRKRSRDPDRNVKNEDPVDSPSLLANSKKRRLTISESAAPHPLRTDLRPTSTDRHQSSSTPISPVVMGFTVQRDNIDQVRSMISVKQKQKALIDQRRGSAAGIDDKLSSSVLPRGISPTSAQHSSLPPPPISFAKRRAALLGGRRKPADILISPDPFQQPPSVQSAPPTQNTFRLPTVAIPTLPSAINQLAEARRLPGNVPPTPTRLSMQAAAHHHHPAQNNPIAAAAATSFVPPTPTALSLPYSQDKAAFLHPFERFYDALNDSRQLKKWLGEQLAKSGALIASLKEERERWDEVVDRAVDKKLGVYRAEVEMLRRKVDELGEALTGRNDVNGVVPVIAYEREGHAHLGAHPHPTPTHLGVSRPEIQRRLSSPGWSGSAASVSTSSSSRSVASGSHRDREREMDTPNRTRRLSISGSTPTPTVSAPLAVRVKSLSSGVGGGRQGLSVGVDDRERGRGSERGGETERERERGRPKEGERRQRGRSTSPSRGRKEMGNLNHAGTGSGSGIIAMISDSDVQMVECEGPNST